MPLQDKGVHIITWGATHEALDVSGGDDRSLMVFRMHGAANQQWTLEWVEANKYRIRGRAGYVSFAGKARDGIPIEYSENNQAWVVAPFPEPTPSETNPNPVRPEGYYIVDETSGLVLDVRTQQNNAKRVFLKRYNPSSPQNWLLTPRPN